MWAVIEFYECGILWLYWFVICCRVYFGGIISISTKINYFIKCVRSDNNLISQLLQLIKPAGCQIVILYYLSTIYSSWLFKISHQPGHIYVEPKTLRHILGEKVGLCWRIIVGSCLERLLLSDSWCQRQRNKWQVQVLAMARLSCSQTFLRKIILKICSIFRTAKKIDS